MLGDRGSLLEQRGPGRECLGVRKEGYLSNNETALFSRTFFIEGSHKSDLTWVCDPVFILKKSTVII